MKEHEARLLLRKALREQSTISIPKLRRILETMNISLKKDNRDREISFLRNEIKRLRGAVRMNRVPIKVKKLRKNAIVPQYYTNGAAGFDLHAVENVMIGAGGIELVRTGLAFEVPEGYEIQIRPRSGLSLRTKIRIANAPGTIDSDYRGEVGIIVDNMTVAPYLIRKGDRIAQGVIQAVPKAIFQEVDKLSSTGRGSKGFGSTG